MTQTHCFKVDKLIRDKLPEIVKEENDIVLDCRILNDSEYQDALKRKLIEESIEVQSAKASDEIIDELADVMEVFESLINSLALSFDDIIQRKQKRKMERGGFKEKVYCHKVFVSPKNQKRFRYYKERPDQYPEVNL